MLCKQCSFDLPSGSSFCMQCGTRAAPDHSAASIVQDLAKRLRKLASTEELEGFSLPEMFSEVFKKRTREEVEEHFVTGASKATPALSEVETGWPKPWFFVRALIAVAIVYFGFYLLLRTYLNPKVVPSVILMGILAFPIATLILFFEFNTPRNVSLYSVIMMVVSGGLVSLFLTHIGSEVADLGWMGQASAGIIEETAKLLAVTTCLRLPTKRWP